MGCTICHDGQGSATDFKWASHTPNDPAPGARLVAQLRLVRQPSLDFPDDAGAVHREQLPEVPSRSRRARAERAVPRAAGAEAGRRAIELVREYGCYGCHEINGFDGPTKRIGPDLRLEPNFAEVAAQILTDPGLNDAETRVGEQADRAAGCRTTFAIELAAVDSRRCASWPSAKPAARPSSRPPKPRLTPATHALADALKDVDTPGRFRKVGPSLRHLDSKVDFDWLYSWIRQPADFRPTTRMPQFFWPPRASGRRRTRSSRFTTRTASEVEVTDREYTAAVRRHRNSRAVRVPARQQPAVRVPRSAAGRHRSAVGRARQVAVRIARLPGLPFARRLPRHRTRRKVPICRASPRSSTPSKGQRWLYSWLKAPNRYHSRTAMPNLFLDPIAETDAGRQPDRQGDRPGGRHRGVPAERAGRLAAGSTCRRAASLSADEEQALERPDDRLAQRVVPAKRLAERLRHGRHSRSTWPRR